MLLRVRTSGALAAGTTVVITESFTTVSGTSAITSTVTSTCAGQRVALGAATPTVSSTIASAGQLIKLGEATSSGISSIALISRKK